MDDLIEFFKPAAKPPSGGAKGQAKRASGRGGGPRVVLVEPGDGLKNITPNTEFITVLFDRPMMEAHSVCGPNSPEITGDVQWDRPHTTLKIPVKLKPNTTYEFYLNCASDHKFQSIDGIELEPFKVVFSTSG